MENKNKAIILSVLGIALFILVAMVFLKNPRRNNNAATNNKEPQKNDNQKLTYAQMQSQFLMDMPCGITSFDSPYAKTVQCDQKKMSKGEAVSLKFKGRIVDEKGEAIENAKIVVNNGNPFYTDKLGFYEGEIFVDSNKKMINLAVDKFGYSPIRKIYNALEDTGEGIQTKIPQLFFANDIKMRSIDVQKIVLNQSGDTVIQSKKYPGVSITIPAQGLVNASGSIVTGEITAEITYLNPLNAEDAKLLPGFNGSMVGVDRKGHQVTLKSGGMVFFHLKQGSSEDLLQPKEGILFTIKQPLDYERADYYRVKNENEQKDANTTYEPYKTNDDFQKMLSSDDRTFNYWYFNQKTGLWEEWPTQYFSINLKENVSVMKISRLY